MPGWSHCQSSYRKPLVPLRIRVLCRGIRPSSVRCAREKHQLESAPGKLDKRENQLHDELLVAPCRRADSTSNSQSSSFVISERRAACLTQQSNESRDARNHLQRFDTQIITLSTSGVDTLVNLITFGEHNFQCSYQVF